MLLGVSAGAPLNPTRWRCSSEPWLFSDLVIMITVLIVITLLLRLPLLLGLVQVVSLALFGGGIVSVHPRFMCLPVRAVRHRALGPKAHAGRIFLHHLRVLGGAAGALRLMDLLILRLIFRLIELLFKRLYVVEGAVGVRKALDAFREGRCPALRIVRHKDDAMIPPHNSARQILGVSAAPSGAAVGGCAE
jgi:hypothetical protein